MAREIRKVPPAWEHPKDQDGEYIPLLPRSSYNPCDWASDTHIEDVCMPNFPVAKATHYVMYETTSEGTPLSPAFKHPEDLARWLVDNNISIWGQTLATYDQWLSLIYGQTEVSLAVNHSGVHVTLEARPQ